MKQEIIDLAIDQLRLGGYDTLSFAAIASSLNTTRANLHHHFKNKEGLALAALSHYVETEKRELDKVFEQYDGDLRGALGAIEERMVHLSALAREKTACVCTQIVRDSVAPSQLREIALERFREEGRELGRQVSKFCEGAGNTEDLDTTSLTFRILSTMHGIDMMGLIEPNKEALAPRIRGSLTGLLD